jgi:hypothetical protein
LFAALGTAGCGDEPKQHTDAPPDAPCAPPVEAAGGADDGSDAPPSDVSGDYTVTLTNLSNTCATETDWIPDAVTDGVRYDIRQDGASITAEAQGNAAVYFIVLTGSNTFSGAVRGSSFKLTDVGPNVKMDQTCTYTINAVVSGTIDGDTIAGKVTYEPVISADPACNPDCEPYVCRAEQAYVGTRAPR